MEKRDAYIVMSIIVISFLLCIPFFSYPIVGDVTFYALEAENIHENGYYGTFADGKAVYETDVPPAFPSAVSLMMYLVPNPVYAVKATAALFFSLSCALVYIFARRLKLSMIAGITTVALLTFSPLYLYFTAVISGTESMSIFFLLLSLYMYHARKENIVYYSAIGLAFGIFTMTRISSIAFVLPFIAAIGYSLLKKGNRLGKASFLIVVGSFWVYWIVRSIVLSSSAPGSLYTEDYLTNSSPVVNFIITSAKLCLLAVPMFLLFMTPSFAYGLQSIRHDRFWLLTLCGFFLVVIALALFPPGGLIVRSRQIIAAVPMFMIIGAIGFVSMQKRHRWMSAGKHAFIAIALIVSILMSVWLNYGFAKDMTDRYYPMKTLYSQESLHRAGAISYLNSHPRSSVVGVFEEESVRVGINRVMDQYIDHDYYVLDEGYEVSEADRLSPGLTDFYVMTDFGLEDTQAMLDEALERSGERRAVALVQAHPYVYSARLQAGDSLD
jgi:hypothetical protein